MEKEARVNKVSRKVDFNVLSRTHRIGTRTRSSTRTHYAKVRAPEVMLRNK